MRYAILSDIHGNVEALQAVIKDIETRDIDIIICLGDIVGYYSDPERCVELVKEHATYSVAGNHDFAGIGRIDTRHFTFYAFQAMEWTKRHLSDESKEFLSLLPMTIKMDGMFFTHSSPSRPHTFTYLFPNSEKAINEAFSSMVYKLNFIGHSHWPFFMTQEDHEIVRCDDDEVTIKDDTYYLINVGSVGQPRNHDPRSNYVIYDTDQSKVFLINVEYDYSTTQQKIFENNLPIFLAERLSQGR